MSFRQFGGLQYASKHNAVASNYNTSNNLLVTQNVGQSNSYINFLSDISGVGIYMLAETLILVGIYMFKKKLILVEMYILLEILT